MDNGFLSCQPGKNFHWLRGLGQGLGWMMVSTLTGGLVLGHIDHRICICNITNITNDYKDNKIMIIRGMIIQNKINE